MLLLLAPLMLIMAQIRRRENAANSISWASLNSLQKGWVFLSMLAPGLAAKLLGLLSSEERERIINAGGKLTGSSAKVALPVLEVFFKTNDLKSLPGKDVEEISRWLNLKFEEEPESLVGLYRKAYL